MHKETSAIKNWYKNNILNLWNADISELKTPRKGSKNIIMAVILIANETISGELLLWANLEESKNRASAKGKESMKRKIKDVINISLASSMSLAWLISRVELLVRPKDWEDPKTETREATTATIPYSCWESSRRTIKDWKTLPTSIVPNLDKKLNDCNFRRVDCLFI